MPPRVQAALGKPWAADPGTLVFFGIVFVVEIFEHRAQLHGLGDGFVLFLNGDQTGLGGGAQGGVLRQDAALGVVLGLLFRSLLHHGVQFHLADQTQGHGVHRLDVGRIPVGAVTHLINGIHYLNI